MMAKNLSKQREFVVELEADVAARAREEKAKPFLFKVSPDSLQNVKESSKKKIPEFVFEGKLDHTNCHVNLPLSGELLIQKCAVDIKSIELQLVRVESCTYMEGEAREATEIQNIQISDGNIVRGLSIPIFMIFPRLFTCATTIAKQFKIEFEVNLIILFADNHMVSTKQRHRVHMRAPCSQTTDASCACMRSSVVTLCAFSSSRAPGH